MGCSTYVCEEESYTGRQFLTAEEKIEKLTAYKDWLTQEAKGVDEAIARIKKPM